MAGLRRRAAWLDRHADAIFGKLAGLRRKLEISWQWCVPVCLTVKIGPKDNAAAVLRDVLGSPLGATMNTLRVVAQTPDYESVNLGPGLALLSKGLAPSCTAIELIDERLLPARAALGRVLRRADVDELGARRGQLAQARAARVADPR